MRGCVSALTVALALAIVPVSVAAQPGTGAQPEDVRRSPVSEPVEIVPASEPAPAAEPEPAFGPVYEPETSASDEKPDRAAAETTIRQRRTGIGLLAAGSVLALLGFTMTLDAAILGEKTPNEKEKGIMVAGGVSLATGVVLATVGGVMFGRAQKKLKSQGLARLRVEPSIDGLVLRF